MSQHDLNRFRHFQQGGAATPFVRFGSKADMCSAKGDVRFTPEIADIAAYSITSLAKPRTDAGISRPSIFAVFMLTTNSNLLD